MKAKQNRPYRTTQSVASISGQMGAMQKRMNEDSAFCHMQMALNDFEKERAANYRRLAASLGEMLEKFEGGVPALMLDLAADGVRLRLHDIEVEFTAKVDARKKLYEETKSNP